MTDCVLCGHQLREHYEDGCHQHAALRSRCACSYVQQPPLPPGADVAEQRARSDWWHRQARLSWDLATEARDDLDRWYALMRFHRVARRAELDHRLSAESLLGPVPHRRPQPRPGAVPEVVPAVVPEYLAFPVAEPQPLMSLAQRLQLAETS